jgi:hypothetical protein
VQTPAVEARASSTLASMLNKRKAMMGWLVWTIAKPIAKRTVKSKAKGAPRSPKTGIFAAVAAGLGALLVWRKRRGSGDTFES